MRNQRPFFEPGQVVICIDERHAPMLRKGRLYRIASRVPRHDAYLLEGKMPPGVVGYWGRHFELAQGAWTSAGPIRRVKQPCRIGYGERTAEIVAGQNKDS